MIEEPTHLAVASGLFLLVVVSGPTLRAQSPFMLPDGQEGVTYSFTIQTDGGIPPLHWTVMSGGMPPGLSLSDGGKIFGAPKNAAIKPFRFTVEVSDSSQPALTYSQDFTILIQARPLKMVLVKPLRIMPPAATSASASVQAGVAPDPRRDTPDPPQGSSSTPGATAPPASHQKKPKQPASDHGEPQTTPQAVNIPPSPLPPASVSTTSGFKSFYWQGLAGIDLTSNATSGPTQQVFVDVSTLGAIGRCTKDTDLSHPSKCWAWLTAKIASVPTAQTSQISALTSLNPSGTSGAAPVPGLTSSTTLGDITQSLEFHGGFEWAPLWPSQSPYTSISWIAEVGAVSPFNSVTGAQEYNLQNSASGANYITQQFNNTPAFASQFALLASELCQEYGYNYANASRPSSAPSSCPTAVATPNTPKITTVGFELPNRTRFYREWATGLRLTMFPSSGSSDLQNFPATFDVKFGQDETVTAGKLRPFVMTVSGDAAVPGVPWLRIFGSAYMRLAKNQNTTALALVPVTTYVPVNNSSVLVQPIQSTDQDYFRIGAGVDFVQAIKSAKANVANTAKKKAGQ